MDKDGSSVAGSVSTSHNQRTSRRPSRLDGNRRTPVGSIISGQSPKAAAAKHPVLLQTINKLEAEQEVRAYELASLRTLVLKVEKEREDALARARQLEEENHHLHEEVQRLGEEVETLHKERNTWKVDQWLESAKGLSHVRAAGAANAKAEETAVAAKNADPGKVDAAQSHSRSPYRKRESSRQSNEATSARTQRSSVQGIPISGLLPTAQGWPVAAKDPVSSPPPAAPKSRTSAPHRAASVPKERPTLIERNLSYAGSKAQGVQELNGAKERAASSTWLPGVVNANSMPNLAASLPELQGALAKLTADREEQAALRQVEVQQLKYTHQQQMKDKEDQLSILSEQVQNAARRIEQLESLLALEASANERSMSVLSPTQSVSQSQELRTRASDQNNDGRMPASTAQSVLPSGNFKDLPMKAAASVCSTCQEQKANLQRFQNEIQELQQKLAEKQVQNEAMTRTAADLTLQLKTSQQKLKDSQQQSQDAVKAAADLAAQLAALSNRLENVQGTEDELTALRGELHKAHELLIAEKQQVESLGIQLEASQLEHAGAQLKLVGTQKELATAISALEAAQTSSFEHSSRTSAVVMENASLKAQYDKSVADLAELQAKSAAMQSQLTQQAQAIKDLQEQLQAMERQLAENEASADLAEQSAIDMMANMQKVIDEKKDALVQSQKQVQELLKQINDLQLEDDNKADSQELLAYEELERKLQDALAQISSMQSSLSSSEGVGMQMMAERLKLQAELEKAHADVARHAAGQKAAEELAEARNLAIQAVNKQLTESNLAVQAFERQLAETNLAVQAAEKRWQESNLAKQVVEGQLQDSKIALQSVHLQLGAALLKQSDNEQLIASLQSEVNSVKQQLDMSLQQLEQGAKEMSKLRLERAEIMGLWGASAARARQLFGNVSILEAAAAAANKTQSEALQKQLDSKLEENARLMTEVAGLKETLEGLQLQLQKPAVTESSCVSKSLPTLEHSTSYDTLRRQIAMLQVDKQQLSLQVDLQTSELKALREQQYQSAADDSCGQVEVLEQQLLETQIQLSDSGKQLLEALQSRDEAEYIAAQAQEQADKANQKVVELKARINTMQNLIRDMASQLSALQAQLRLQRNPTSTVELDNKPILSHRPESPLLRASQEAAHRVESPSTSYRFLSPQPPSPGNISQKTTSSCGPRHRTQGTQNGQLVVSQAPSSQPQQSNAWVTPDQDQQWDATINVKLRQSCPAGEATGDLAGSSNNNGNNNNATVQAPSKAEAQALYKRLRSITALYGLDVGAMVRRNATPMQLWNALYATIAALESRALTSTNRSSTHSNEPIGRVAQHEQLLLSSNKEKLRPTSAPHHAGKLSAHR